MTQSPYSIGIDIGGTKISSALVDTASVDIKSLLTNFQELPTPKDSAGFLDALLSLVEKHRQASPHVSTIGISTAGIVNSIQGKVLGSTGNLPGVRGVENLKERIEAQTGLFVHVENDANAAAFGECRAGAGVGLSDMVMVTLGTGVGTGIVINGQMVRGGHFSAGEGGHIPISNAHERQCTCGRWDCWEAFASGTGLAHTARQELGKALIEQQQTFLAISGKTIEEISTHQVIEAFKAANPLAKKMIATWHHQVALGLRAILNLLDPQAIVVGGGMAQFVDFGYLLEITQPQAMMPNIQLRSAILGNQAGIVGAAYLAHEAELVQRQLRQLQQEAAALQA